LEYPLISVITTTYNAVATFEKTIESVINQSRAVEYIVIDGNSTDGTIKVAQQYRNCITVLLSEPDNGIYDAMNKGIDRATGEWLYFLGADDALNEGVLEKILPYLNSNVEVVYGNVIYDTGHIMHSRVGLRSLLENTLHHQSAFYHRNLFEEFRYNTSYKINADYELTLRIYLEKRATRYVPYLIATCGSTGASSTLSSIETNKLRGQYLGNSFLNQILSIILNGYYNYFNAKKAFKASILRVLK
jgi:putative colanic acid biosynthesis glycosyltransferase